MASKQYIYMVQRRDFDHHTDKKGTLTVVEVHADAESANTAARAHLTKESKKAQLSGPEIDEGKNKDGGYKSSCRTFENRRDNFEVEVKKMELKGATAVTVKESAPKASKAQAYADSITKALSGSNKASSAKTKQNTVEDDAEADELEEQETGQSKKAAAKKVGAKSERKQIPDGIPGALQGLRVLFTGTFDMDRKTCIAAAEDYGAEIVKKLTDTDYVILGVKAGPKKLQEIEEHGLDTLDEEAFLEMLQTGVPQAKRDRMAAAESGEPAKKKQRK